MNSFITNINRSVNIWKLTDYEKKDIYVDIYLYMKNIFENSTIHEYSDYVICSSSNSIVWIRIESRRILVDRFSFFNPLVNKYGSIFSQYYITDVYIFIKYFISEFLDIDLGNKYLETVTLNYE